MKDRIADWRRLAEATTEDRNWITAPIEASWLFLPVPIRWQWRHVVSSSEISSGYVTIPWGEWHAGGTGEVRPGAPGRPVVPFPVSPSECVTRENLNAGWVLQVGYLSISFIALTGSRHIDGDMWLRVPMRDIPWMNSCGIWLWRPTPLSPVPFLFAPHEGTGELCLFPGDTLALGPVGAVSGISPGDVCVGLISGWLHRRPQIRTEGT